MPINRPDGRHWCDPASETPDDNGGWKCPDCGQEWLFDVIGGRPTWETPDNRASRRALERQTAEAVAAAEAAGLLAQSADPADVATDPVPDPNEPEPAVGDEREDF